MLRCESVGSDFLEHLNKYVTGLTLRFLPSQNAIRLEGEVSLGSLDPSLSR